MWLNGHQYLELADKHWGNLDLPTHPSIFNAKPTALYQHRVGTRIASNTLPPTVSQKNSLAVHFESRNKRFLRDIYFPELAHFLLTGLLLVQKLALA